MLDLIFLVLFIIAILRSLKGQYDEKFCVITTIIGIVAAFTGIIICGISGDKNMIYMNFLVLIIAIAQRYAARHLAKMYNDKIEQSRQDLEKDIELHSRKRDGSDYQIADADFDNEEIRFGKGGLTPYNEEFFRDDENTTINGSKK